MDIKETKWSVYVLESLRDSRLYIGISQNARVRLKKHNAGGVCSTKYRRPLQLLGHKEFRTFLEARTAELALKRFKNPARVRAWILA